MAPGSRKRVFSASGIFSISVRRGRGTVDVEGGGGVVKGDGPLQEKNHFIPQKMISLSAFWQFLTVTRKPWDTDFTVQSWNELKQNYPKVHSKSQTGGGDSCTIASPWIYFQCPLEGGLRQVGDHSAGSRRFHVADPLTAKLRCPVAVRACGTSRTPVAADCRCWRPEMAVAGMQRSLR